MLNQFGERTRKHIEKLVSKSNTIDSERVLVNTMICTQKIIREIQEIMDALSKKNATAEITELLIFSMKLELLYKTIRKIRHECTL